MIRLIPIGSLMIVTDVNALLRPWSNFWVIVGSSAGALTGLQFVVIALVAQSRIERSHHTIDAFGTPTIVHFCAALLAGAILSAPWQAVSSVGAALAIGGAAGVIYSVIVYRRARAQTAYRPVLEDWIWHIILPFLAYASAGVAGIALVHRPAASLFAVAVGALVLLFVGIHNAWDTVTYITVANDSATVPPPGVSDAGL